MTRKRTRALWTTLVLTAAFILTASTALAAGAKENTALVTARNGFADDLLAIHNHRLATRTLRKVEKVGSYARMPDYFNEVSYYDGDTLMSRIRWLRERPDLAQMIELFVYDDQGRLSSDYYVSYLTEYRNAPMFALANVHAYDGDLHAFRQFDSGGDILYERCQGKHFGQSVDVERDEPLGPPSAAEMAAEVYTACFGFLPLKGGKHLRPARLFPDLKKAKADVGDDGVRSHLERQIDELGVKLSANADDSKLLVERGQTLFLLHRFDDAIADFTAALKSNETEDEAYFGRGMARGRSGDLDGAVSDLGVYIERNPTSAKAHTKRGVRHIWRRDFVKAEKDLRRATELDADSAEAHDDLGVVLAQTGRLDEAHALFLKARSLDPTYKKVHHNLAMVYFMGGDMTRALAAIDDALALDGQGRGSLMLKGNILDALGRKADAVAVRERAEFLPEGNWSEQSTIK